MQNTNIKKNITECIIIMRQLVSFGHVMGMSENCLLYQIQSKDLEDDVRANWWSERVIKIN